MFRGIGGNGAFRSIASARSFPIVGQVVGQALVTEMRMLGKFHFIKRTPHSEFALLKQRISLSLNRKLAYCIYTHTTRQVQDQAAEIMGSFMAQVM